MSRVNFIPSTVLASRRVRNHLRGWIAALIASACVTVVPFALNEVGRAQATELTRKQSETAAALAQARREVEAAQAESKKVEHRIECARALRTKRAWSSMMVMIGNCLPADTWLVGIATDPPFPSTGAAPAAAPVKQPAKPARPGQPPVSAETVRIESPQRMTLVGYALDQGQPYVLMENLKGTEVFKEVRLVRSGAERLGEREVVGFVLSCGW